MEWLFGLALLPVLLCGLMCAGGAVLAFLGVRQARRPSCHAGQDHAPADESPERVAAR